MRGKKFQHPYFRCRGSLTRYSKRKTGFSQTDNAVNKLIGMIVTNGLLTASFTILHLTTFLSLTSGLHMIFNYANVKLYSNAVLASLNSRRDPSAVHYDEDKLKDRGLNFAERSSSRRPAVEVTVTEERHETVDIGPLPKSNWPQDASDITESFDGPKISGSV
ncbi:hypothetical protein PHLGIDRAFT_120176 [Phlebiopsis gigantea 11061_1 CR5-6]|uniref:DUF6534 domain-containing protein n=1 Tax=Phlebiopsis gigantea (strain 11061_1 CR5-6) TaxID=745531 RepID=A0A0C3RV47_PHLG1|nr:hypothetical protein PHLGIDRAFT_120176 [Phlebiopsis gigantea 11061_1 CR5-6]